MGPVERIVIYKRRHRLEVWGKGRLLKTYTVAIGHGGAGHKQQEGDDRTPEGRYHVVRSYPSLKFHRFLLLSYPSGEDQRAFLAAKRAGKLPAAARIGGDIGIHGEKRGFRFLPHKWVDWTRGCVALDDAEIEELYAAVRPGTAVVILP